MHVLVRTEEIHCRDDKHIVEFTIGIQARIQGILNILIKKCVYKLYLGNKPRDGGKENYNFYIKSTAISL